MFKIKQLFKSKFLYSFFIIGLIAININHCLPNLTFDKKQNDFILAYLLAYPNIEIFSSPNIQEGQSINIFIRLKNQPIEGVHIPIFIYSDLLQSNPNSLYFSPETWNVLQTIQIFAPEDDYYFNNHSILIGFGPFKSNDLLYDGRTNSINLNYSNNDMKGLFYSIVPWDGRVNEGSDLQINFSLHSIPRDNVYVNLVNPSFSDFTFSHTTLTFTPSNWNITQTVNVNVIDDNIRYFDRVFNFNMNTMSNDDNFNNLEYFFPAIVVDNDIEGFQFNPESYVFTLYEGNIIYTRINLNTIPTNNVNISITSSTPSLCNVISGNNLLFTPENYNIQQIFSVQARPQDNIDNLPNNFSEEGTCIINVSATSVDPAYNGFSREWRIQVIDSANARVVFSPYYLDNLYESSPSSTTFTLQLNSEPTSSVKVCIKSTNYCEAEIESTGINPPDGTCIPIAGINTPYVIFDSTNWNIPKTIHVKSRHDWNFRSTPTETGNTCNPPYPDGTKFLRIRFNTTCSGCNEYENIFYNVIYPDFIEGSYVNVIDDLDYFSFVTQDGHDGDFQNDLSLPGFNPIIKGDSFCNQQKPTNLTSTFKALLVDSTNRKCNDPSTCSNKTDWMLLPNKYYFRYEDNQLMFRTNSNGLFIFTDTYTNGFYGTFNIWTGIAYTTQWSYSAMNCNNWVSNLNTQLGKYGIPNNNSYNAVSNPYGISCDTQLKLLCIQQ